MSITVELPPGTKLETTEEVVGEVEDIIRKEVPELETIHSTVGGGGSGMGSMFGGEGRTHMATVEIELVDIAERDRALWDIEEAIRPKLSRIPSATVTFGGGMQMGMMGTGEAPISIEIYGYNMDEAERIANQVKYIVERVPGTRDIEISLEKAKPEFNIVVDRDRASGLGLPVAVVADAISSTIRGKVATRFREGGDEFNVKVRLREDDREW